MKQWVEQPQNLRVLYYYLLELVRLCSQSPERVNAWLQTEKEATGKSVFQATYLNFFRKREVEVLRAMAGKERIPFEAKAQSDVPMTNDQWPRTNANSPNGILSGQAPYGVLAVIIDGHPEAKVEWTSDVCWKAGGIQLLAQETELLVKGVNEEGKTVAKCRVSLGSQPAPSLSRSLPPTPPLN